MILRQGNWLGQQRVDVPHLRAMESSVAADFDVLAGRMFAGKSALVLRGFNVVTTGAIGNPASALQVVVADGLLMHFNASENGTLLWVPSDRAAEVLSSTNTRVSGSFTASQTNYIGLDLSRSADQTTADNVQFMDSTTLAETSKTIPLARTLDYRLVVSTTDFGSRPNILPIAQVVTDGNNNVVSVADARQLMYRLGSGGDFPSTTHSYPFPGTRKENTSGDVFSGGDKSITSLKDWMDAAMTRLWEVGGGEYWYSATADRNVTMIWTGTPFTDGENFEWTGSNLHWKGLRFLFDNSTGSYNDVQDQLTDNTGQTDLNDGECIYVDLDRTQNRTGGSALVAAKASMVSLGTPAVPGSRYIIAWRSGTSIYTRNWRYAVGQTFQAATTTSNGVVKLSHTATSPSTPVVYSDGAANAASGVIGLDANKTTTWTSITGTPLTATSGGGNGHGLVGTGAGTGNGGFFVGGGSAGNGILGTGGASSGIGLNGIGGSPNGTGVSGTGSGNGNGVLGTGGSTSGIGVNGIGGGPNGNGVVGQGQGTGNGGFFTGGSSGANGVLGTGGTSSGIGLNGIGGSTNGTGVFGTGAGTGNGVRGVGGPSSGIGGNFTGGAPNGLGILVSGTGTAAAAQFTPGASQTTAITSNGDISLDGATNPATTTPFKNIITKKHTAKAWGRLHTDGAGGVTVQAGCNIASVTIAGTGIQVTFAQAFSNSLFAPVVSVDHAGTNPIFLACATNVLAGTFQIYVWNVSTNAAYDLSANARSLNFAVFGDQ